MSGVYVLRRLLTGLSWELKTSFPTIASGYLGLEVLQLEGSSSSAMVLESLP